MNIVPPVNIVLVVGRVKKIVFSQGFVIGENIVPISWMVAYAQVLVTCHQVYVEPLRKGHASRGTIDIGVVNGNIVFLVVNLVDVGDVLHLDVSELYVRAEGTSVLVFHVLVIV